MRKILNYIYVFTFCLILFGFFSSNVFASIPYNASDVLGQVDFDSSDYGTSATALNNPMGLALDSVNHRLFIVDQGNNRVLVFNLNNSNILVDKTADYVFGQTTFLSSGSGTTASTMDNPWDVEYDQTTKRLYVVDGSNSRILIFDLTSGITNGMNASWVIGQPNFTSYGSAVDQSHINTGYTNIALDTLNQLLFVAEYGNKRVTVFNVSTIVNGENAVYVLGQPDFTSSTAETTQTGMSGPVGVEYDSVHKRLFVGDYSDNRILVYDLTNGITNGMNASYVLCQPDFTSNGSDTTQNTCSSVEGVNYDSNNNILYAFDYGNYRVFTYDLSSGITNGMNVSGVLGQIDFDSSDSGTSQNFFSAYDTASHLIDIENNRFYYADADNYRVLIYSFIRLPSTLATPTIDKAYTYSAAATQSQGTVTYSITSGSLPDGLSLNTSTGEISGTPTKWGTFTFTLKAVDNNGAIGYFFDTQTYTLRVGNEPPRPEGELSTTLTPICSSPSPSTAPTLFQVNRVNRDAILYFTPVRDNNSYYFISYGTTPEAEGYSLEIPPPSDQSGAISQDIHALSPKSTYYFKVRGGNNCMPGPWSEVRK